MGKIKAVIVSLVALLSFGAFSGVKAVSASSCSQAYQASGSLHRNVAWCSGLPAGTEVRAWVKYSDPATGQYFTAYGPCRHDTLSYTPWEPNVYGHGYQLLGQNLC